MYRNKPEFQVWSSSDDDDDEVQEDRIDKRYHISRKGVGIIDVEQWNDGRVDMYCPHCKAAGFKVKLGPKILMPNEQKQPDYENWLECKDCHEVVASYVVEHDATIITDAVETVNNPFENQTEIIGISKRTSKQGIKAKKKRNRPTHPDKEIQREIDQHGIDAVNILYDTNR